VPNREQPPLDDLLSNFALGPAWARGEEKEKRPPNKKGGGKGAKHNFKGGERPFKGGGHDRRQGGKPDGSDRRDGSSKFQKAGRPFKKGGRFEKKELAPPAEGVRVTIQPDAKAVRLIVKEVQQVARVYSLFDIASTLLSKRERCVAIFERKDNMEPMWRSKAGDALYLSKEDAQANLWHSGARGEYLEQETIDVDPPSGNFQAVAKCGLSGKWLGPPNFHTYQTELRRLHQQRFANMPFEAYAAKVRTERGEDAVNAWLETMTKKTRWRKKGAEGEDAWTDDLAEAQRLLSSIAFEATYESTHHAELPASATGHQLSGPLKVSLKLAFNHASKHAAMVIPALCKILEAEHLPVFKRKGKLYTGPVRPQPLPKDATLAPRPAQIVDWIRANREQAKLEGLWNAVLPEGSTAPPAQYAADLFWLLQQGHIQLHMDDTLVVMEEREPIPSKKKVAKKVANKEAKIEKPAAEESAPEGPAKEFEVGMSAEQAEQVADLTPEPPAAAMEVEPEETPGEETESPKH